MSEVHEYLRLGVELANRHIDLGAAFKDWPKNRSVVLRVCNPHPEVEAYFAGWLQLYVNGELREGAVIEEPFNIYLDVSEPRYQIVLRRGPLDTTTVTVFISEAVFWDIAGRTKTIYTAFITGSPLVIKSTEGYDLRDLAHLDLVLSLVNQSLLKRGIDLTSLVK